MRSQEAGSHGPVRNGWQAFGLRRVAGSRSVGLASALAALLTVLPSKAAGIGPEQHASASPQPVVVLVGSATGAPGAVLELPVRVATRGQVIAGVGVDVERPNPGVEFETTTSGGPDCTPNADLQAREVAFSFAPDGCVTASTCRSIRALVALPGSTLAIEDGAELFRCRVRISTTDDGIVPLPCALPGSSSPSGVPVPTTCTGGGIVVATIPATPNPTPIANAVLVRVGSTLGDSGSVVEVPVSLTTAGNAVSRAGVRLDLAPQDITGLSLSSGEPDCSVNPAIGKTDTSFSFGPPDCDPTHDCTVIVAIVQDFDDMTPIPDGVELFACRFAVTMTTSGVVPIGCSDSDARDPAGTSLASTCEPGAILVPPRETPTPRPTRTSLVPATPTSGPVVVRVGTASGNAFDLLDVPVSLTTSGVAVAGLQIDLLFTRDAAVAATQSSAPNCQVNPAIAKDATTFTYMPQGCVPGDDCVAVRAFILSHQNTAPIADGANLFRCRVQVATSLPSVIPLGCASVGASAPSGVGVPASCSPGGVVVVSSTPSAPTATSTVSATPTSTATPTATTTPTPTASDTPTATATPVLCSGDCDGDNQVSVAEIVLSVSIVLGLQAVDDCTAVDRDRNRTVEIFELIEAVANALGGCTASIGTSQDAR